MGTQPANAVVCRCHVRCHLASAPHAGRRSGCSCRFQRAGACVHLIIMGDGPRLPVAASSSSQATFVFPIAFPDRKVLNVYMGDHWNPYGPGGVANATYLWLPLQPRQGDDGFFIQVCCVGSSTLTAPSCSTITVVNNLGGQRLCVCRCTCTQCCTVCAA